MDDVISRRGFLGAAITSTIAADLSTANNALPTRVLGRTRQRVTILALGCGSRLIAYREEDKAVEAINLAIDSGIRYIDTAQNYGAGKSETWVGKVMKHRRKEVFLATKVTVRGYDEALRETDRSLERLQTDRLDLVHVHGLAYGDDLAKVEAGLLKALYRLRDQKVTRFIGVTSHVDPKTLAAALERHDFDCTQMALNAALQGRSVKGENLPPVPANSFERVALPVASRKNLGVIAMKVTAQEGLLGAGGAKSSIERLLRYSLSLSVSAAVVGMPKLEFIRENVGLARSFKPMPKAEMESFSRQMSEVNKAAIDYRFSSHQDA